MKKLIGVLSVVLFSVVSIFASEWQSAIYDNIVDDICIVGNKVYTATNGGIEIFSKDGKNLPGESAPWKVYTTVNGNLPENYVDDIAVRSDGYIFARGYYWLSWLPTEYKSWQDGQIKKTSDRSSIGYDLVVSDRGAYAALMDGLYYNGGGTWEKISVPHIPYRLALANDGTLWMTWSGGIFSLDTAGHIKDWQAGKMVAGAPLNIAVWGDTVIVSGTSGAYIFTPDTASSPWVLAYHPQMQQDNNSSVAYFKGHFYVGQKDGSLWWFNSGWKLISTPMYIFYGSINCLATDGDKLYLGTNNKTWVYDGTGFTWLSVTGVHYPHDNNILHVNRDNTGRILVGGWSGGYCYDNTVNSPMLNSSVQNIPDNVVTSLVDIYGNEWIGSSGYINVNNKPVYLPNLENGLFPYWLVRGTANGTTDVWMVTANPTSLQFYAGGSHWFSPPDAPAQLAGEKVLSVNSTGKRVWIGTDSSLYSYDFHGNWTYKRMQYSTVRFVAGDFNVDGGVWVADGGYAGGAYDVTYYNVNYAGSVRYSWPYQQRRPNAIYLDHHGRVWACTDSGVYYKDPINLWQALPLTSGSSRNLADNYVNTIYVDSATDAVWFGTAGGLTVWHRLTSTSVNSVKPALKVSPILPGQDVVYFDIAGRKINPSNISNLARGQIIFRRVNGVIEKMNLNLNRLR
jgi:hypothetical protein